MTKVTVALGMAIIFGAVGDILFSRGMQANGEVNIRRLRETPGLLKHIFTNPLVLVGMLAMAIQLGSYIAALAWVDVSVANPLTALSYVVAVAYAAVIARERVNSMRWSGVICITLGSVFVGLSA